MTQCIADHREALEHHDDSHKRNRDTQYDAAQERPLHKGILKHVKHDG